MKSKGVWALSETSRGPRVQMDRTGVSTQKTLFPRKPVSRQGSRSVVEVSSLSSTGPATPNQRSIATSGIVVDGGVSGVFGAVGGGTSGPHPLRHHTPTGTGEPVGEDPEKKGKGEGGNEVLAPPDTPPPVVPGRDPRRGPGRYLRGHGDGKNPESQG